ncbi:protein MOS2-like [Cucurbita maxima]|uniref:Protein MOS2-like n=1 Tax=Cucurbita maxima TaxID=3661 RepID=A0A6J1HTX0_CUCMA|nr:protein MOS2-like [Cucurbita maxima]XP_022967249.1 protein MOS2-like [Cucurbita maxima]XP_022967250.1 protein MOS2-like [Cucurbita maxima]
MKLSFSLPSKSSSSSKPNLVRPSKGFDDKTLDHGDLEDSKEYVNEFDASKPFSETRASSRNIVIPSLQNEWRPLKRMKNLEVPLGQSDESDLKFESASGLDPPEDSKMSFGLNVRQSVDGMKSADDSESVEEPRPAPLEVVMLEKFKADLKRLPEDRGFEDFEEVPVESFAAALMEGYGWRQGRGIGRNAKEDVKVKEYNRRTDKQGLGFVTDVPVGLSNKKDEKDKEREREKNRDGDRVKENRDRGSDGLSTIGKHVRIIGGRDAGLKGKIVEKLDHDWLVLKLRDEHVKVKVRATDIVELGSKEEERFLRKLEELKVQDVNKGQRRRREVVEKRENGTRDEERKNGRISWVTSHIRVRIISKDFKGGKFYLKKGEIVDVVGPSVCDISIDGSRELVQGVSQELLETALPRRGGPVLVLYGKHKGVYGSLVERDLDKETGVVRDADSHELLNVRLEQIAEYIGDPSYLGY